MIILAGKSIINSDNIISIEIENKDDQTYIKFYLRDNNGVKIFYKNEEDAVEELNLFYNSLPTHNRLINKYKFKYNI